MSIGRKIMNVGTKITETTMWLNNMATVKVLLVNSTRVFHPFKQWNYSPYEKEIVLSFINSAHKVVYVVQKFG